MVTCIYCADTRDTFHQMSRVFVHSPINSQRIYKHKEYQSFKFILSSPYINICKQTKTVREYVQGTTYKIGMCYLNCGKCDNNTVYLKYLQYHT